MGSDGLAYCPDTPCTIKPLCISPDLPARLHLRGDLPARLHLRGRQTNKIYANIHNIVPCEYSAGCLEFFFIWYEVTKPEVIRGYNRKVFFRCLNLP